MSTLDDKLGGILDDYGQEMYLQSEENGAPPNLTAAIAQIKAAFDEEGYRKHDWAISPDGVVFDGIQYHTGQEWYDRFMEQKLKSVTMLNPAITQVVLTEISEAAKRAAGLDESA
jgi:hypothetical protein